MPPPGSYVSIPDTSVDASAAPLRRRSRWLTVAVPCCALGALMGTAASSSSAAAARANLATAVEAADASRSADVWSPTLQLSSDYERRLGRTTSDGLLPFNIAEVYRATRLSLSDNSSAIWSIPGVYVSAHAERGIDITFPQLGEISVHLTRASAGGGAAMRQTTDLSVSVRLVRRELRSLTTVDRERYFAALRHVYMTAQSDGELRWGRSFKSAAWLVREHLAGAAQNDCDHWHDDAGIMNHHIGVTWQLEQSLHAIDHGVAAHYWDYTIDASETYQHWWESIVFDDDWFGAVVTNNSQHVVTTGRFAYTPIMREARGFSNITNPYGLLRSPWNTNPTPYLMRSRVTLGALGDSLDEFPTCAAFSEYVGSSLSEMLFGLNGALHGPVHIMIGGQWNLDPKYAQFTAALDSSDMMLLLSKFFWRSGLVRCPEVCDDDTPADECTCSCPRTVLGERSASDVLEEHGLWQLASSANLQSMMQEYGVDDDHLLQLLCSVGHPGEMFTSAAPQDPLFWPLHGLAERFLQYVRILKESGEVDFDESWGYAHSTQLPSDTGVVCDWSDVTPGSLELPDCAKATCSGHKYEDELPFKDLITDQDGLFTNGDFYHHVTSPFSSRLPYAYDTLTSWPGCPTGVLY